LPGITPPVTDPAPTFRTALGQFAAFLRRPQVLTPLGWRAPGSFRLWLWLTGTLVVVLMLVLLPFLRVWQQAFDLPAPDAFGKMPQTWLVPTVVLLAPILEELLFRGWQTGRAAALWLLGCAGFGVAVLTLMVGPGRALMALGLLVATLIAAALGWWKLRRRTEPLGWFVRAYPAIFFLAAALFGLIHLSNYPHPGLLSLPLILPQVWAGLMLGYVRQRIGLTAAMAAHITANACSLGLAFALG
jgi:membrane protease YdiL (CAAX protease family)